jgi:hypothetical protein
MIEDFMFVKFVRMVVERSERVEKKSFMEFCDCVVE